MSKPLEADIQLNQLYQIVQGMSDLPKLLDDLEGKIVPYNIIMKIKRMMISFPINLAGRAKALRDEMERTGYPK